MENLTCIFAVFSLCCGELCGDAVVFCTVLGVLSWAKGVELPQPLLMALSRAVFRAAPDTPAQPVLSLSSPTAHVSSTGVF